MAEPGKTGQWKLSIVHVREIAPKERTCSWGTFTRCNPRLDHWDDARTKEVNPRVDPTRLRGYTANLLKRIGSFDQHAARCRHWGAS